MASAKRSAGLLLYRPTRHGLEVLIAHPGGPFFRDKDAGAWTVPKGLIEDDEDPLRAARREFAEETGLDPGDGPFVALGDVRQRGGKLVSVWACAGDCDPQSLRSNNFELEWPPGSGRIESFPEVDRLEFFDLAAAREKLNPAQVPLLARLVELVGD